ncbi:hypothetical protein EV658_103150 [Phaeovulum veldkampii DSM 11550]|nr:hypothetical protein EV658_103150 [Phaeovulum veldkampii DSM 11550]
MPPGPPPGMVVKARQVSWLAARTPAAPSRPGDQWHGRWLAAHSCGGSAGLAPASLFARGIAARTKAPRRCGGGPVLSTGPAGNPPEFSGEATRPVRDEYSGLRPDIPEFAPLGRLIAHMSRTRKWPPSPSSPPGPDLRPGQTEGWLARARRPSRRDDARKWALSKPRLWSIRGCRPTDHPWPACTVSVTWLTLM